MWVGCHPRPHQRWCASACRWRSSSSCLQVRQVGGTQAVRQVGVLKPSGRLGVLKLSGDQNQREQQPGVQVRKVQAGKNQNETKRRNQQAQQPTSAPHLFAAGGTRPLPPRLPPPAPAVVPLQQPQPRRALPPHAAAGVPAAAAAPAPRPRQGSAAAWRAWSQPHCGRRRCAGFRGSGTCFAAACHQHG